MNTGRARLPVLVFSARGGGDTDLYRYTFDDPTNFVDPDGLAAQAIPPIVVIGGVVIVVAVGVVIATNPPKPAGDFCPAPVNASMSMKILGGILGAVKTVADGVRNDSPSRWWRCKTEWFTETMALKTGHIPRYRSKPCGVCFAQCAATGEWPEELCPDLDLSQKLLTE